jgi:hypothetical protein
MLCLRQLNGEWLDMGMRRRGAFAGAVFCVFCVLPCRAMGQASAASQAATPAAIDAACGLQQPSFVTSSPNIFNAQQEQDLGDALAEFVESDMHLANSGSNDELTRIGERLLAVLPPSGVHYHFRIYDSGEVNGFSTSGGRVTSAANSSSRSRTRTS